MKSTCFSCNARFDCGADNEHIPCWCTKKSTIPISANAFSCLCESCFAEQLKMAGLVCFRLHISYIGSSFAGFQEQSNARTVGGELRRALREIIGSDVKIKVAGRTDAHVHARGQVASIECKSRLSPRQLTLALACKLPKDMTVFRVDKMPLSFDARRHSIGKQYFTEYIKG